MEDNKSKSEKEFKLLPIDVSMEDLTAELSSANDPDSFKKLVDLFNFNQAKKNVIRTKTYSDILDKVADQMLERFNKNADEFSNADLLNYLQATQTAMEKASKSVETVNTNPAIQLNQLNINVENSSDLSRESREKIKDVITKLLLQQQKVEEVSTPLVDEDVVEISSEESNSLLKEEDSNE